VTKRLETLELCSLKLGRVILLRNGQPMGTFRTRYVQNRPGCLVSTVGEGCGQVLSAQNPRAPVDVANNKRRAPRRKPKGPARFLPRGAWLADEIYDHIDDVTKR